MDRESMIRKPNTMKDKEHSGPEMRYFNNYKCITQSSNFQTLTFVRIILSSCLNADSVLVGLGCSTHFCIYNQLSSDIHVVGPWTTF